MKKHKKGLLNLVLKGLFILFVIMFITTPTHEKFDKWILREYGISCEVNKNFEEVCRQSGEKINFKSYHFRNAGIYASYEKNYEFENREKVTIRTLGVFGMLFQMEDGYLWDIVN